VDSEHPEELGKAAREQLVSVTTAARSVGAGRYLRWNVNSSSSSGGSGSSCIPSLLL